MRKDRKVRILLAKAGPDTHVRGISILMSRLRDAGMETIYTGLYQSPETIVTAAVQEDVDFIFLSSHLGRQVSLSRDIMALLKKKGADKRIALAVGGVIPKRDFAPLKELGPGAKERAKDTQVDMSIVKKMANMGLLAMNVPEKYGGQKVSWVTVGIAIEEMAKVDFTVSVLPTGSAGYLGQAMNFAPEYLQDRWFKPVIDGDILACLCLTEPDAGSDAVGIKTKAVKDGNDYVLNGEKTSISWGMQAGIGVVFAKTDPAAGARGVTAFLLPTDTPGITKSSIPDMGWPTAQRASFFLDDVRIPADHRLGEEGQGFFLAMNVIGVVRICLTLQAIGHAEGALDEAIAYAKQRTAFGRPLANFQAVSFKIAEEATKLEAARLLCYRSLGLRDAGERHLKEASMAKWFGARSAMEACHEALLIHGQIGYSEECRAEQRLRNVIGSEIGDGTAEIMKLNIARELIGKEFQPL